MSGYNKNRKKILIFGGMTMLLTSATLRLTWTVIEETPINQRILLPDTALVRLILQKIATRMMLTGEDVCELYGYIGSKISLIRDVAESQLMHEHHRLPVHMLTQMSSQSRFQAKANSSVYS
jgi:hypothetical protein